MNSPRDTSRHGLVSEQLERFGRFPWWTRFVAQGLAIVLAVFYAIWSHKHDATVREVVFGAIAVLSFISALVIHLRHMRLAAYASCIASLHHAVHHVRDEIARASDSSSRPLWTPEETKSVLRYILDRLVVAFSMITQTRCRACIKALKWGSLNYWQEANSQPSTSVSDNRTIDPQNHWLDKALESAYVVTVCRDSATTWDLEYLDEGVKDPVIYNTPYLKLLRDPRTGCWSGEDIGKMIAEGRMVTTSQTKYGQYDGAPAPLPFASTLVWPIRVSDRARGVRSPAGQYIYGFLCIDSPAVRAFTKHVDSEIGALIADLCFIIFKLVLVDSEGANPNESGGTVESPPVE